MAILEVLLFREIGIFDTDDNLVKTFSASVFLYPSAVEFSTNKREAYVLGKNILFRTLLRMLRTRYYLTFDKFFFATLISKYKLI